MPAVLREVDRTFWLCLGAAILGVVDLVRAWKARSTGGHRLGWPASAIVRGKSVPAGMLFATGTILLVVGLGSAPFTIHHFQSPAPAGWTSMGECKTATICATRTIDGRPMSYQVFAAPGPWDGSESTLLAYGKTTMRSLEQLGAPRSERTEIKELATGRVGEYVVTYRGVERDPTAVILIVPAGTWHLNAQFVAVDTDSAVHLHEVEEAVSSIEGVHDVSVSPLLLMALIMLTRFASAASAKTEGLDVP